LLNVIFFIPRCWWWWWRCLVDDTGGCAAYDCDAFGAAVAVAADGIGCATNRIVPRIITLEASLARLALPVQMFTLQRRGSASGSEKVPGRLLLQFRSTLLSVAGCLCYSHGSRDIVVVIIFVLVDLQF
jgi:hypothetical protein